MEQIAADSPGSLDEIKARAELDMARERPEAAIKRLKQAVADHPEWPEPWIAQVEIAQNAGQQEDALNLLAEADKHLPQNQQLFQARISYWLRRGDNQTPNALVQMINDLEPFPAETRTQLTEYLANALSSVNESAESLRLWKQLAAQAPDTLRYQIATFDQAFRLQDDASMQQATKAIRSIDGAESYLAAYADAARLVTLARRDATQLDKARASVNNLANKWPGKGRVSLLRAELAEIERNTEAAIAAYREAIQRGETQPIIIRRLVKLLYDRKEYDEADKAIRELRDQGNVAGADFDRIEAEVSAVTRGDKTTEDLADAAVKGSTNFDDYVWRGQILMALAAAREDLSRADRTQRYLDKAEQSYIKAAEELAPKKPEAWIALTRSTSANSTPKPPNVPSKKPRNSPARQVAAITLARGYEILGRN